jgi:hypothetical protein
MTYEEFILSKIINKDVENYELLLEAMLQTSVAPSTYLSDKISKQKVSIGLLAIFGEQAHKSKNTSFNFYFLKQYREKVLGLEEDSVKTCSGCKLELSVDNFYSNGYQPNDKKKYKSKCKNCQTVKDNSRKEEIILKVVGSYSCKLCGYNKCKQALEFHHLDPTLKEYRIADLITHKEDTIIKELEKCILVCANCHREIHYGLRPEYLLK